MSNVSVRGYLNPNAYDQAPSVKAAANDVHNSGGGEVIIDRDLTVVIASPLDLPTNVVLRGEHDLPRPRAAEDLVGLGSTLLLDVATDGHIGLFQNCGLSRLIIRPTVNGVPMHFPQTAAQVANWAGRAMIRANGAHGVLVERCIIVGFANAFLDAATFAEQLFMVDVEFDCKDGIQLRTGSDICKFENVRGWPLGTTNAGDDAANRRPGTAFSVIGSGSTRIDAPEFLLCFAFGYKTGFHIEGTGNAKLVGCTTDYGAKGSDYVVGYQFAGSVPTVKLEGCSSYRANRAIEWIPSQTNNVIQVSDFSADVCTDQGFYAGGGSGVLTGLVVTGPSLYGQASTQEGVLFSGVPSGGRFGVSNCYFDGTTYALLSQGGAPSVVKTGVITGSTGSNTVAA